jgi:hypothetical protein
MVVSRMTGRNGWAEARGKRTTNAMQNAGTTARPGRKGRRSLFAGWQQEVRALRGLGVGYTSDGP